MSAEVKVVVGPGWGDEGKGKITDTLVDKALINGNRPVLCVRGQGGPNAGHTIVDEDGIVFDVHCVPSGIFHPGVINILGQGTVFNPNNLIKEFQDLSAKGIDTSRVFINPRAHIIFPFNQALDGIEDDNKGQTKIGTTRQGIGPTYADKHARIGLRADLLRDKDEMIRQLYPLVGRKWETYKTFMFVKDRSVQSLKEAICQGALNELDLGLDGNVAAFLQIQAHLDLINSPRPDAFRPEYYVAQVEQWCRELGPRVRNTDLMVRGVLDNNGSIIIEGSQGGELSIDASGYPFTTSSNTSAAGVMIGAGVPFNVPNVDYEIHFVQKAVNTRVGSGPFVTKMTPEQAALFQDETERGVTTGRVRDIGFFDGVMAREQQAINQASHLDITKLDFLREKGEILVCDGYELNGRKLPVGVYPDNPRDLYNCTPIYSDRTYRFEQDLSGIRSFNDLPNEEQTYLAHILSFYQGAKLAMVGVGRRADQLIIT